MTLLYVIPPLNDIQRERIGKTVRGGDAATSKKIGNCWDCGGPVHHGYGTRVLDTRYKGTPKKRLVHKGQCEERATERVSHGR